jgi:non-haem Fe2+, alpha-ketoglutarate-dependent halogenase
MTSDSLTLSETFERDGYLTGIRIASPEEIDRIRGQFDALEACEGRERSQIGLVDRHFDQPFIWEIAIRPAILDVVEAVVGPDILLLATHFFCKYGQTEKHVDWHQDVTYWGLEPPFAVTAWVAVDDSDVENGCMRVIPGSHREGIREHGKSERTGNLLSINQAVPVTDEEESRAVNLELRAGEMSLHHGALIHGSLPNRSERRRCGLTLRYVPPTVRPVSLNSIGKSWNAVLVRGEDRYKHFGEMELKAMR